jgi:TM2 domain-containing membrane protein YozV
MKKTIFLAIILITFLSTAYAQRYSINKLQYDYHQYVPEFGDPYNPAISGIYSLIIPGLGQMYCGEAERGLAFFGGYTGCAILFEIGASQIFSNIDDYGNSNNYGNSRSGAGTMLLGLGGMAIIEIWSIVDAVHVAKVNNMYIRDLRRTSGIKFEISPYVDHLSINNQATTPLGMTMRVTF